MQAGQIGVQASFPQRDMPLALSILVLALGGLGVQASGNGVTSGYRDSLARGQAQMQMDCAVGEAGTPRSRCFCAATHHACPCLPMLAHHR